MTMYLSDLNKSFYKMYNFIAIKFFTQIIPQIYFTSSITFSFVGCLTFYQNEKKKTVLPLNKFTLLCSLLVKVLTNIIKFIFSTYRLVFIFFQIIVAIDFTMPLGNLRQNCMDSIII